MRLELYVWACWTTSCQQPNYGVVGVGVTCSRMLAYTINRRKTVLNAYMLHATYIALLLAVGPGTAYQ